MGGRVLGGSSQVSWVVRITIICKAWNGDLEGFPWPYLGDLRSSWLLSTYKSWDDPPSGWMDIGWRNSVDLEVCLFLGIFFSMYRKKPIILGYPFLLFSGDKYPLLGGGNSKIFLSFTPNVWGDDPISLVFSDGLEPPTSIWYVFWQVCPWKVTMKIRMIFQSSFCRGELLTFGGWFENVDLIFFLGQKKTSSLFFSRFISPICSLGLEYLPTWMV